MTVTFTPEQDQYLQLAQTRAYYEGLRSSQQLERDAHRWGSANTMYNGY